MADVIQLLPENIANQIAAGEVIQRPASVVKELMENAIDAGSTDIKVVIKEAGKSLIQVTDNGCGMSETDAQISFARHATSKIRKAQDLFSIKTMGFRGEALPSIAAIAQMEMKTRRQIDELGIRIVIEGSEIKTKEPIQCNSGTTILVKNLFFNIPVRRNFLKSNNVELKHITDEFHRIALAHPDVFFSLHHNGKELYHLPPGNLRQRLTGILGGNSNKKLVPIFEDTDVVKLSGFVGKPEFSRKTRGEQWFFVNNRFIKSQNLHQSVMSAFENLLQKDTFPLYAIFIDLDPARIDINVHPTKQEIKFDDEKVVYNYLRVAIRHALGQHSVTPSLDFDQEMSFTRNPTNFMIQPPSNESGQSSSEKSYNFNLNNTSPDQYKNNLKNWEKIFQDLNVSAETEEEIEEKPILEDGLPAVTIESTWVDAAPQEPHLKLSPTQKKTPYQIHNTYIVSPIKTGFLLIDQQNAHERILYEAFLNMLQEQSPSTQQQLFPKTMHLSPENAALLKDILSEIKLLGFDVEEFGTNTFVINGVPALLKGSNEEIQLLEVLLDQYKSNLSFSLDINENIARSMAKSASIKKGQPLSVQEMQALIDKLFACELPFKSPSGKNCFITFSLEELSKRFEP